VSFAGALCGPPGAPCRKLIDEAVDPTSAFRNRSPAIATDAQGRPHVLFYVAVGGYSGYYTVRGSGGWTTPELLPTPVATASLVVGADGLPVALVNSGAVPGTSLWKRDATGWRQLDGADIAGYEALDTGSLVATQDGCVHAGLLAKSAGESTAQDPAYGLWNGRWNLTSFGHTQRGGIVPGVALAADGIAEVALWKYDSSAGTVDWAARGRSLEPVDGLVGGGPQTTRAFITVVGAQSGQEPVPYVFYRAVSGSGANFPFPSNLVLARRSSNGTWNHQTMATSSGTNVSSCGTTGSPNPCTTDGIETVPVGIVSSGNGDVRVFFTSTHSRGTWVWKCTTLPGPICSWQAMTADGGSAVGGDPTTFEMGWINADGTVGRTVLDTNTISSNLWAPSVTVDVQGRIHVAHFQGGELKVQYLQFGP
jgi:hypothetical protein